MSTSDSRAGFQADDPAGGKPQQGFDQLKDDVSETLAGARQQADAQFGEYRDSAAEQIEALAQGAKSFAGELQGQDTLGMADYLSDMAQSMSGLAGNLRGKSAEQLLHDATDMARSNPTLFIAGSIALGFGLSRFLKAGSSAAVTVSSNHDPAAGNSTPPATGYGAHRPYESSPASTANPNPGLATGITPTSPNEYDHPSDFAGSSTPVSPSTKGEF